MIHILQTTRQTEIHVEDIPDRWCFVCRARRLFRYRVTAWDGTMTEDGDFPTDAWYGPSREVRCTTCGTVDGDLFPGYTREWDE